ncbi:hypothetical protein OHB24_31735 [Kribbella sp. NBC_00482]|uniref:hypothetical protein n=1 Tax=Kribbella sp. NBC_00482 TaxID=2975968 RepID=UPI002E1932B1
MAQSEVLDPADIGIVATGLADGSVGVRAAAFEALSRLPLPAPDWRVVGRCALRVLAGGGSAAERQAVIEASPSIPLRSVRDRVAEFVDSPDPELSRHAAAAVREMGHARTVPAILALPAGDSDLYRIALTDISGAVAAVRAEFGARAAGSEDRFWLALALALSGEDAELRAVVEPLAGLHRPDWYRRVDYRLREVMAARRLPEPTARWLSEPDALIPADLVSALTVLPDLAWSYSHRVGTALRPGWSDGRNPGFSTRGDPDQNEAREADELYAWISDGSTWLTPGQWEETTEELAARVRSVESHPVIVSRLMERASVAWDGYHSILESNTIVTLVGMAQGRFRPDVAGLFDTYREVMTRSWQFERSAGFDEASVRFGRADDEGGPRSFCLQIGWIVSRGGLPGLVPALAEHLRAADPADRIAAAYLIADAAAYVTEAIAPQFGGGSGPDREAAWELVDESDEDKVGDETVPAGPGLALQEVINSAVSRFVTEGRVLFNPPDRMRKGHLERVEVAVARTKDLDEALLQMVRGQGQPRIENIETSPFMAVELKGSGFDVTPLQGATGTEQLLRPTALWEFDVLPLRSGFQTLQVCVAMRIPIQDRSDERVSIPVLERQIRVAIDTRYSSQQFLKRNWQWLIVTLIGFAGAVTAWLKLVRGGE